MRYTPKLELKLPEPSDPAKISDISENFEKLDDLGAGVEAVKNGTGPGSLFLVSKYYKEPVKDALLCNGGYASVAQYPELYEVLGSKYGMQMNSTKVSSAYGITTTNGYPTVYNAKHDAFVLVRIDSVTVSLIVYRKNAAPFKTTIQKMSTSENFYYNLYTAGDCVWGRATVNTTTSSASGYSFVFDFRDLSVTAPSNLANNLVEEPKNNYINYNRGCKVGVTKDYVCYLQSYTRMYVCKISGMSSSSANTSAATVTLSGISSSVSQAYIVHNFDDAGSNRVYIVGVPSSSSSTAMWIYTADIPDDPPSAITCTLKYTISFSAASPTYYGNGFIVNGYYICTNYSGGWKISYSKLAANGTSSLSNSSVTIKSDGGGGSPAAVARLSGGMAAIFLHGTANAAIFDNGTVSLASNALPGALSAKNPNGFISDKICTEAGPVESVSVSTFKLPSISLSESLVYMRTKGT